MTEAGDSVRMIRVAEESASWDGKPLPAYPAGTPCVTILRASIPPRARLHLHSHPVINAGLVLRGELTVVAETGRSGRSAPAKASSNWSEPCTTARTGAAGRSSW